jgi:hypothetical protein
MKPNHELPAVSAQVAIALANQGVLQVLPTKLHAIASRVHGRFCKAGFTDAGT